MRGGNCTASLMLKPWLMHEARAQRDSTLVASGKHIHTVAARLGLPQIRPAERIINVDSYRARTFRRGTTRELGTSNPENRFSRSLARPFAKFVRCERRPWLTVGAIAWTSIMTDSGTESLPKVTHVVVDSKICRAARVLRFCLPRSLQRHLGCCRPQRRD